MIGFGDDFFSAEIWKEIGKGLKLYFATNMCFEKPCKTGISESA
jgi:hypothetical protein